MKIREFCIFSLRNDFLTLIMKKKNFLEKKNAEFMNLHHFFSKQILLNLNNEMIIRGKQYVLARRNQSSPEPSETEGLCSLRNDRPKYM